ncbi:MAG: formylglycine-generating enzyme family protein [Bacteroidales bacterium]|nr:formylglycine-generating enzyme family protein [Bacteroidales bacterium]
MAKIAYNNYKLEHPRGNAEVERRIAECMAPPQNPILHFTDTTFTVGGVSFTMKAVEGGTFTMGCTREQGKECNDSERPEHKVTVNSFCMGETEVTQELWKTVMGTEPSFDGGWKDEYGRGEKYPATLVSWEECQEFIRKLSDMTGANFRLPTEAEWEYAARGGNRKEGYKYSGSNQIDDVACCKGNTGFGTRPVMTKQANALGLYDMSGNVFEWCSDLYGDYISSPQSNPQGPDTGKYDVCRVLRGGSWTNVPQNCRVSYRGFEHPAAHEYNIGFRLVWVP